MVAAVSLKVERALRTEHEISGIELAAGYPVARWLNDTEVDRDARRYFRSLATKAPYLQDVKDAKILDAYYSSDFFHGENKAVGLGMAFLLDALAISFHSHSIWGVSSLQLRLEQLDEEAIATDLVPIRHACLREHVLEHRDWIKKRAEVYVENGADLYRSCETVYPNLRFCASTLEQMQVLSHGEIHLRQIMKHLLDLNSYCANWRNEVFSPRDIAGKVTAESEATLLMYKREHTFLCPDGEERVFSWHCRVTPEPWRIYFFPLVQERLIIVGYIGVHLPTVKFHT